MDSQVAAGYLAAMIDGEGTVGLYERKLASGTGTKMSRNVSIANTERSIIDACVEAAAVLDIPCTVTSARAQNERYRPIWYVNFNCRPAFDRLMAIVPIRSDAKRGRLRKLVDSYRHVVLDPEQIRAMYWDERLTVQQVAERLGEDYNRILWTMTKYGIPRRSLSEAVGASMLPHRKLIVHPDEVRRMYWDEGMSTHEIGRSFGTRGSKVLGFMRKHGIPSRAGHGGRPSGKNP